MKIHLRCALAGLVLAISAFPALAAESPAEQYQSLSSQFTTAVSEYSAAYRKATTPEARAALKRPEPGDYAPRILAIAESHPNDSAAVDALVWLATTGYSTEQSGKAYEILARKHAADKRVAPVCEYAPHANAKAAEDFLKAALERNSERDVQAKAAKGLYTFAQKQGALDSDKYLEMMAEKFADVPDARATMGEFAKSELEHNKKFGLGKVAPEIEGDDISGVKFKLSEYRGKVVVIDFWGDW